MRHVPLAPSHPVWMVGRTQTVLTTASALPASLEDILDGFSLLASGLVFTSLGRALPCPPPETGGTTRSGAPRGKSLPCGTSEQVDWRASSSGGFPRHFRAKRHFRSLRHLEGPHYREF
jgi:hypothetical protein